MDELLNKLLPTIQKFSLSISEKEILVNKPWTISDREGNTLRYIFKRNHRLIITRNNNVKQGKWEYFPDFNGLILTIENRSDLFRPAFFDKQLLILKLEGPEDDYLSFANEELVPDLDSNNLNALFALAGNHAFSH
jgi:hypothetical protein